MRMHDAMKPKPALRFFDLSRKQSIRRSFRNSRIYCIEEVLIVSSISKMLVVPNWVCLSVSAQLSSKLLAFICIWAFYIYMPRNAIIISFFNSLSCINYSFFFFLFNFGSSTMSPSWGFPHISNHSLIIFN